ncbi:MAG: Hsp20/alpha crystallin family protein [Bacteroidia bacterium]
MTLVKFKNNRDLLRDSLFPTEFNSLVDTLFNESLGKFERNVFFKPRVDVKETENNFQLQITLPGLKKEEISIDIEGDVLTVSGERKLNTENKDEKYHLVESYYGKFTRSFTLPETIKKENIDATLNDGILTLVLPKAEVKKNKTSIEIK